MCTALQSVGTSLPRSSTSYLSGSILASSRWLGQFELWRNFAAAMFFTLSHLSGSSLAGCLGQFGLWRNLSFWPMLIPMPMLSDPGGSWECQFATKSMSAMISIYQNQNVMRYQYIKGKMSGYINTSKPKCQVISIHHNQGKKISIHQHQCQIIIYQSQYYIYKWHNSAEENHWIDAVISWVVLFNLCFSSHYMKLYW